MPSKYLTLRIPRNLLPSLRSRPDGTLIEELEQFTVTRYDRTNAARQKRWRDKRNAVTNSPSPSPSRPSPEPLSLSPLPSPVKESRRRSQRTPPSPDGPVNSGWEFVAKFLRDSELLHDKVWLYDWVWWKRLARRYEGYDFDVLVELGNWEDWLHDHRAAVESTTPKGWRKRFTNWLAKGYGRGGCVQEKSQTEKDAYWVRQGFMAGASNGHGRAEN